MADCHASLLLSLAPVPACHPVITKVTVLFKVTVNHLPILLAANKLASAGLEGSARSLSGF